MQNILEENMRKVWPFDSIIISTANENKRKQFVDLFSSLGLKVKSLRNFSDVPVIIEDQPTFEGNAIKKAEIISKWLDGPVISDDSGIVVPVLDGEPGVYSARYAGENATDEENNQKLLNEMIDVPENARSASYVCVMAIAIPDSPTICFYGECHGTVLTVPRGNGGFGYDPLFYLPNEGLTMAELPSERKYQISHRGEATSKLVAWMRENYTF